jgi:signal transduction histidine kinase
MKEKTIQILLVEDNEGDARLVREMFRTEKADSFQFTHLSCMRDAEAQLAKGGVDVVLLDLSLPDTQGIDTMRRAHAAAPDIPMIVLTGLDDEDLAAEAMKEGAQDYLVKGELESRAFPRSLRHAIDRHRIQMSLSLVAIKDIAERKATEEALREVNLNLEIRVHERTEVLAIAKDRAESADRLKSAFLATMSHELRTPLNSIIGFTGILVQGLAGPLNLEQAKQLKMVQGSARHLLALINDVLDISKIEAEQLRIHVAPFDLYTLLERVIETVKPLADKKGLAIRAMFRKSVGQMVSDERRVEQILLNLLSNALKFTQEGEVALIVDDPADLGPSGRPACACVQFRVTDTGIGIKAEELASLFQPFKQLETGLNLENKGTGLGLAISRRLAQLLDGGIDVSSQYGTGSVFVVTLPRRMDD